MTPERWQQVQAIFDGVLGCDAAERPAFLERACAQDPALRAEVDALLDHEARAEHEHFLTPPAGRQSATPAPDGPPAGAPSAPQLADYDILGELGRGGMSIVYRARQRKLNRLVALKMILNGEQAGPRELARFRAEAEALARLRHPNIVQIHDVGEHDGRPFFALELVDGGSLKAHLGKMPLPPRQAAQLVRTLASAVQAAHEAGIVHRDLKPANVLLQEEWPQKDSKDTKKEDKTAGLAEGRSRERESGRLFASFASFCGHSFVPKIADFGLAKWLDGDGAQTQSGAFLGTPSYAAPEQATGQVKRIGPATDVYALGAILYELLVGRPPFRAETPLETLRQVTADEPVAPRALSPRLPRDLETICLKCLEKEPHRRYASAWDLAEDLRRFQDGEPVRARPAAPPERALKWARRHPALALLVAIAVAVPLALGWHTLRLQHVVRVAQQERDEALRKEKDLARQLRYAADMRQASQLFNAGDVVHLPNLLDPYDQAPDPAGNDLCGFEWWHLRRCRRPIRPPWQAHGGPVQLLTYMPDGRSLLTAGGNQTDQSVAGWDLATGRQRWHQPLSSSNPEKTIAAEAPGAAVVACVTGYDRITLLDAATGNARSQQLQVASIVGRAALSPDGRWLVAGGSGPLALRDLATGKPRPSLPAPPGGALAFAPDGRTLAVAGNSPAFRGVQWWEPATGKLLRQETLDAGVAFLSYSPRGSFLLIVDAAGQGMLWATREQVAVRLPLALGPVRCLAVSPDEQTLAAGDAGGGVRVWDLPGCRLRAHYRWQPNPVVRLAFSPDGRSLAAGTSEGVICQLDATDRHTPDGLRPASPAAAGPLAWSPDGKTLAMAARDGTVQLRDGRSGEMRTVLHCPVNNVHTLAFAPDGRTLATVCDGERVVRLWDANNGRSKGMTPPCTAPVTLLAFAPDGRTLAIGEGTRVRLWEPDAATERGILDIGQDVRALAFTPDRRSLLAAGSSLQVWDLSAGAVPRRPASAMSAPGTDLLAIAADGRTLATADGAGRVCLWRVSRDRQLVTVGTPHTEDTSRGPLTGLAFGPDGTSLLLCRRGEWALWDIPVWRPREHCLTDGVTAALAPDGSVLATTGADGVLQLWDLQTRRVQRPAGQLLGPVTSLAFAPDGRVLTGSGAPRRVIGGDRRLYTFHVAPLSDIRETVRLWDAATGLEDLSALAEQLTLAAPAVVAASAKGHALAAGAEDGSVWVWDGPGHGPPKRLFITPQAETYARWNEAARRLYAESNPEYARFSEGVTALVFAPDGCWLAAAGTRGALRVWAADGWRPRLALPGDPGGSAWVGFTPDGKWVAVSRGGQVRLWDVSSGQPGADLGKEDDAPVLGGAFAPAGAMLATACKDGAIRFWDLATGKVAALLPGHQAPVTSLAFTPDGKTLASGSWDRSVRLWNVAAAQEVAVLEGHAGRVQAVAFAPDGRTLATGSDAGEVRLWRADRP